MSKVDQREEEMVYYDIPAEEARFAASGSIAAS